MGRLYFGNGSRARRELKPFVYKGDTIIIYKNYKKYGDGEVHMAYYSYVINHDNPPLAIDEEVYSRKDVEKVIKQQINDGVSQKDIGY